MITPAPAVCGRCWRNAADQAGRSLRRDRRVQDIGVVYDRESGRRAMLLRKSPRQQGQRKGGYRISRGA